MNKKTIVLTSLLSISFLSQANMPTKTTPLAELVKKAKTGELTEEEQIVGFNILKDSPERVAEESNLLTICFQLKKDNNHDKVIWLEKVKEALAIADSATKKAPEKLLTELFKFIQKSKDCTGDESGIHGLASIGISSPDNHATLNYTK